MIKTKVVVAFIIICICCPFHSFAGGIHEEEKVYVDREDETAHGDTITPTGDLSVPNRVISSVDINADGEILVCYDNKIIVFNNEYAPIKAFDVRWGRVAYPSAVWNQETGRIVYVRCGGYEIDDDGKIVAQYEGIEDTDYRPKRAEGGGVAYKLEDRVPLPNLTDTYSTLVSVDSGGNKTVLHNAIWAQFYLQFNWVLEIIVLIGIGIHLIVREHKKAKTKEAQGNE